MEILPIVKSDPYLSPYADAIWGRYEYARYMEKKLTGGTQTLADFASGYLYFGLHKTATGWVFREWAPNATAIYLIGDFNQWEKREEYALRQINNGNWEIRLPEGVRLVPQEPCC